LLWVLFRRPSAFARTAALVSAAFDLGWAIYTCVPTAPPWWAGKHGHLAERVDRVTVDASRVLPLVPEESEDQADAANPWASMPSTHVASALMLASAVFDEDHRLGVPAYAYAASLAVAVVYLGEHYVADVIGAVGLVVAIRLLEHAVRHPVRRRLPSLIL
jgi:membrane-associated phospholipid phosphatase